MRALVFHVPIFRVDVFQAISDSPEKKSKMEGANREEVFQMCVQTPVHISHAIAMYFYRFFLFIRQHSEIICRDPEVFCLVKEDMTTIM